MISHAIFGGRKHTLATSYPGPDPRHKALGTRLTHSCYFEVFKKLTRACYFQIALEIMLSPVLI